jgi:DNA polymerase-3 subunit gamma/tau
LEQVKLAKMSCGTYLSESEPVEVADGLVVFGFPTEFKFHRDALDKPDNKELVRGHLSALLGREVGVAFVVTEAAKEAASKKPDLEPKPSTKETDIISSALNIFEGSKVVRRDPV